MLIGSRFLRPATGPGQDQYCPPWIYSRSRRLSARWRNELKKIHPRLNVRWNTRDWCYDTWFHTPNGQEVMLNEASGWREANGELIDVLREMRRNRGRPRTRQMQIEAKNEMDRARESDEASALDGVRQAFMERDAIFHRGRIASPVGIAL